MVKIIEELGGRASRVTVHTVDAQGTYRGTVEVLTHDGKEVVIDVRASDALALAIAAGIPIIVRPVQEIGRGSPTAVGR
jgi:bifunctional DNase/RNase